MANHFRLKRSENKVILRHVSNEFKLQHVGRRGPQGIPGDPTKGLPVGGSTRQSLIKSSSDNYDTEWATLNKADVGLEQVDNTSDADKIISDLTQDALDAKASLPYVAAIARPIVEASLLDLPTPDGNPAVTHPSVIEAPNGSWNGYRYWMAMTPYPTEPRENPCVLVSNDKRNWIIPPGGSNPVVPISEAIAAGYEYGSDTELIFIDDTTLMMFYRFAESVTPPLKEVILYKTSTDGITWSAPVSIGLSNTIRNDTLLSPAVIRIASGGLAMYTVKASGSYGVVERRLSTDNGLTWSAPTTCTTPNDHSPWHISVRLVDGVYYLLSCDRNPSAPTVLVFMTSTDGLTFTGDTGWSIPLSNNTYDAGGYYRSTFLPSATKFGGMLSFDVFASVMNSGKTIHRVALFENVTPNREASLQRSDNAISVVADKYRVLLADSFTRKSASGIGSPDVGPAWERYQDSGSNPPVIVANKVRFGSTTLQAIIVSNAGSYFGTLSALITLPASGSTDGGLVMCAGASNANFIQIAVARDAATYNRISISTHIGGAITTVATNDDVNLQYATTHRVDAALSKTGLLNVFLDGKFVLSYALTSPQLALYSGLTRHGIYSHYDAVTFYSNIIFTTAVKPGGELALNYGTLYGLKYIGGEGYIGLEGSAGLRIKNDATAQFRLLPVGNNVYFQNTVSSGDMYFTGASGADLTGSFIFRTSNAARPATTLAASLGIASAYWKETYSQKLYLNSTMIFDGTTPGVAAVTGSITLSGSFSASNIVGTNTGDQTATTVSNSPSGNIAATNVQAALNELDNEKLAKAGGTMTGALLNTLATGNSLVFDTNTLVVDATNHRVGIGTDTPVIKLHVKTTATASGLGTGVASRGMALTGGDSTTRLYFESVNATSGRRVFAIDNSAGKLIFGSLNDSASAFTQQNILSLGYDGTVGIGTASPTGKLHVSDDKIRIDTAKTPTSATATGNAGEVAWDANYMYVCVATNVWKRSPLSTW